MKVPRHAARLVLSKACRPPTIKSPPYEEVIQALQINPPKRTQDQIQTIFRYLLLNKKLLKIQATNVGLYPDINQVVIDDKA